MQYREYENWGINTYRGDEVGKWLIEWATLDEPLGEEGPEEMWLAQGEESVRQRHSLRIQDSGPATELRDLNSSPSQREKFLYSKWKHSYLVVDLNPMS